jgi:hypothetical protein
MGDEQTMKLAAFFQRFRDDQEIGRDITDRTLEVYYDNGTDVGRVVQDRRSTRSHAELLDPDSAVTARHWCKRQSVTERSTRSPRDR